MGYAVSKWYKWDSLESFNTWHEAKKEELKYPLTSVDSDGLLDESIVTNEITSVLKIADGDFRALVEDDLNSGLIPCAETVTAKTLFEVI